jgi:hypothetical protein
MCHTNHINIVQYSLFSLHMTIYMSRNQLHISANIYYSYHRVDYKIKSVQLHICTDAVAKFPFCLVISLTVGNRLTSITNLVHKFFYSITTCMSHYNPRHVSSINMPIFRRTNCIIKASGIVTVCKRLYSMLDESRLQNIPYSRLQML